MASRRRTRKKRMSFPALLVSLAVLFLIAWWLETNGYTFEQKPVTPEEVIRLEFPVDRYPETAKHIREAIEAGESAVCTIDRDGSDENRRESLKGIPTKQGYDRDEWPMAVCREGGAGADIEYIPPSDNRGAGSWVGNQLDGLPDGTQVMFIVP